MSNALSENLTLLHQLLFITLGCLRNTVCMRGLSVLNDVLILVGSRSVLWKIGPVSFSLTKCSILKLFARIDGAWEFVWAWARAILLSGLEVIFATHVWIKARSKGEAWSSAACLDLISARSKTITILLFEMQSLTNNCVSFVRFLSGELTRWEKRNALPGSEC